MAEESIEKALVVNNCSICKIKYCESKVEHSSSLFHHENLRRKGRPLTIEEFGKKMRLTKSQTLNVIKKPTSLINPAEEQKDVYHDIKMENKYSKKEDIKLRVQEHSHNNHHGLPGKGKYAHRGATSQPGKNHAFRKKKN